MSENVDVAIVGAGVSGLYTGYRLLPGMYEKSKGARPARVTIYELSDRYGGRLESVQLPGMSVVGELGGMRYMAAGEAARVLSARAVSLEHAR